MSSAPAPLQPARPHRVLALPATRGARRASALALGVVGLLVLLGALGAAGVPDLGWGVQLAAGLTGLAGLLAGVVAGGVAVHAIVRGERSVVLVAPLLVGAFGLLFLLGELLVPH